MKKRFIAFLAATSLALVAFAGCGGSAASSTAPSEASAPEASSVASVSEAASETASEPEAASEPAADGYSTTLADIQANGKLVVGLDDTFAPMGFRDTDGTLVGFDIDLATAVCEQLGVEAEFQPIDWGAKEMELSTGNIDCIWNGMSATAERQEIMSLSQNYLNNKIIVMTNEGVEIASKEDLVDYNIGTQAGSAALEVVMADDIYSSIEANLTEYPTYDECILDMNTGRIDCMVIDEVLGNYKNAQIDNKFGVADFDFGDDFYAIGFRKSDTELTGAVNDALNALIADGTAAEISVKWFGTDIVLKP